MTAEEFKAKVTELLTTKLKAEAVAGVVEKIVATTNPEDYEAELESIRFSFDWSVGS